MIKAISFGITYLIIRLFSFFPFFILNGLSWIIFQMLDKIIHYRQQVILRNLRNAFPEKSQEEIRIIKTEFYRYFSRLIMENIKMYSLSPKRLEKYIHLKNPEVIRKFYDEGVSVAAIAAHYGNWEWLLGLKKDVPFHTLGIYKPLNNSLFNTFITGHRSRYNTEMINMRDVPRVLRNYVNKGIRTLTLFIADQSPVWEEIQYWTKFLNQNTAVYLGPEKLAQKLKLTVIYFRVNVLKNHRYEVEAIPLTEDASKLKRFELTEAYLRLLEEDIINMPCYWLWSHRRWKLTEKRDLQEKQGIYRFEGHFRKK